jgi:hypothetical protein
MFVAEQLQELKDNKDLAFANVVVIDAASDVFPTELVTLTATPAIMFVSKGSKMTIRRPGWLDSDLCT